MPPVAVAPLIATQSPVDAPCATSVIVITLLPDVVAIGFIKTSVTTAPSACVAAAVLFVPLVHPVKIKPLIPV